MDPNSNGWFTGELQRLGKSLCPEGADGTDHLATARFFSVFSVIFELTSAYGTVGLSLGTPYVSAGRHTS